jgi:D-xylose transport system ATP-binding protein
MPDVFEVCDRVTVMKNGRVVGTERVADVTPDDVLGMIILGKQPERLARPEAAAVAS